MRCSAGPDATVTLAYATREVIVGDLVPVVDPGKLDLCREHIERMVPPRGWTVLDERELVPAAEQAAGDR